jgi:prepilin-type N-terminal cleavage/methylation domain-containing protein
MQPDRQQRQRGFTLVEALIALVILSFGLFGLMQLQTRVMAGASASKTQTIAANLSQQKLEELRVKPYADIHGDSGKPEVIPAGEGGTTAFTRSWSVTEVTSPSYKKVSVTTSWIDAQQTPESLTLTSFIAESTLAALEPVGQDPAVPPPSHGGDTSPVISVDSPYDKCTSSANPCSVVKNTTITPSFIITDDTALSTENLSMTTSGNGASTSGSITYNTGTNKASQGILTPNGSNKTFSVAMSANDGVNTTKITLYFKT